MSTQLPERDYTVAVIISGKLHPPGLREATPRNSDRLTVYRKLRYDLQYIFILASVSYFALETDILPFFPIFIKKTQSLDFYFSLHILKIIDNYSIYLLKLYVHIISV